MVLPYDLEICKAFGEIKAALKNSDGSDRTIGVNDLWIAACAKHHSLKLLTHNRKHFEGIPGVDMISEAPPTKVKSGRPPATR